MKLLLVLVGFFLCFKGRRVLRVADPKNRAEAEVERSNLTYAYLYFLVGTFVLVTAVEHDTRLFSPVDSFTIGGIALLIATEGLEKGDKQNKYRPLVLFLSGTASLFYFVAGVIGVLMVILSPPPGGGSPDFFRVAFENLEKSFFVAGSISLMYAAIQFTELTQVFASQKSSKTVSLVKQKSD